MRPRILIDCDGVTADFATSALNVINKELKLKGEERFNHSHIQHWDICQAVGHPELDPKLAEEAGKAGFCRNIEPYVGAKEGVATLQQLGEVFVVTAPFGVPNWVYERGLWLKEHLDIEKTHVVHTSAKFICQGDVLIDDKPENLTQWMEHNPEGLAILWHQPYNADFRLTSPMMVRAWSWEMTRQVISLHTCGDKPEIRSSWIDAWKRKHGSQT